MWPRSEHRFRYSRYSNYQCATMQPFPLVTSDRESMNAQLYFCVETTVTHGTPYGDSVSPHQCAESKPFVFCVNSPLKITIQLTTENNCQLLSVASCTVLFNLVESIQCIDTTQWERYLQMVPNGWQVAICTTIPLSFNRSLASCTYYAIC